MQHTGVTRPITPQLIALQPVPPHAITCQTQQPVADVQPLQTDRHHEPTSAAQHACLCSVAQHRTPSQHIHRSQSKSQHAPLDPSLPGSRSQEALPSTAPPRRVHTSAENACYRRWASNSLCAARDWQLSVPAQKLVNHACDVAKTINLAEVSDAVSTHVAYPSCDNLLETVLRPTWCPLVVLTYENFDKSQRVSVSSHMPVFERF